MTWHTSGIRPRTITLSSLSFVGRTSMLVMMTKACRDAHEPDVMQYGTVCVVSNQQTTRTAAATAARVSGRGLRLVGAGLSCRQAGRVWAGGPLTATNMEGSRYLNVHPRSQRPAAVTWRSNALPYAV